MRREEYNGYTNYETWLVNLWLNNDEATYNQLRELVVTTSTAYELGKALQEWIQESIPEAVDGMFMDLINAGLSEVDWMEIAEAAREAESQTYDVDEGI